MSYPAPPPFLVASLNCNYNLLLLLVLRRSLQIPIPAWAMKATVFSSSGRGPYSFVCMSTLSLQMDCLTLLYSLQSCSTCWAVSAACPHEQRSVSPTLNRSTLFQLGALIFHLLFLFIGFSTQEGTRSTHLASSPEHGLLLFCCRFIEIASI